MACLIIAELDNGFLNRPSLATISAATQLSDDIDIFILSSKATDECLKVPKIRKVIYTHCIA